VTRGAWHRSPSPLWRRPRPIPIPRTPTPPSPRRTRTPKTSHHRPHRNHTATNTRTKGTRSRPNPTLWGQQGGVEQFKRPPHLPFLPDHEHSSENSVFCASFLVLFDFEVRSHFFLSHNFSFFFKLKGRTPIVISVPQGCSLASSPGPDPYPNPPNVQSAAGLTCATTEMTAAMKTKHFHPRLR